MTFTLDILCCMLDVLAFSAQSYPVVVAGVAVVSLLRRRRRLHLRQFRSSFSFFFFFFCDMPAVPLPPYVIVIRPVR